MGRGFGSWIMVNLRRFRPSVCRLLLVVEGIDASLPFPKLLFKYLISDLGPPRD